MMDAMDTFDITSEIRKIQICTSLIGMLKKQLHRVCKQVVVLDDRLASLLRRYDIADKNRCYSVRENLTFRIAVTEGVRNMLNEWIHGRSVEIVRLQRMVIVHERVLIERIQHGDDHTDDAEYADNDADDDDDDDDDLSWNPDDYSAEESDTEMSTGLDEGHTTHSVGGSTRSNLLMRSTRC